MRFFRECYETSGKPYEIALEHHKSRGYEPTAFVDGKKSSSSSSGRRIFFGEEEKAPKETFEVKDEWAEDDGFWEEEEEEEVVVASSSSSSSVFGGVLEVDPSVNQTVTYEVPPTLPAWWLPDFVAVIKFSSKCVFGRVDYVRAALVGESETVFPIPNE